MQSAASNKPIPNTVWPMWFLQTSVDALLLPTDGAGRTTLTGNVSPWHHLVRNTAHAVSARTQIVEAPVRWSIWPWQQAGRRVQLPAALAGNESLAFMVRAEPARACVYAHFPEPGKRKSDRTIELIVVVPPEHFNRYEALIHFAMTLPSGFVGLTVPAPALLRDGEEGGHASTLIGPGSSAVMEGMEMVVARGKLQKYGRGDIRTERRLLRFSNARGEVVHDDDDEWLLFAASPLHEQAETLENLPD